jgi:molybdopterin biosynthesis enzyme
MSAAMRTLSELFAAIEAQGPLAPRSVASARASGLTLAADLFAARAAPERARAKRVGLAVAALDLVGAAAQSPALLARRPEAVVAGAPLPGGADAVLDAAVCEGLGPCAVLEAPTPGAGARLSGHDVARGAALARAGETVSPALALAADLAGLARLDVRAPRIFVRPGPIGDFLRSSLAGWGCEPALEEDQVDLIVVFDAAAPPRLGLEPGAACALDVSGAGARLTLAPTPEAAAAALAILAPLVARWTGRTLAEETRPLAKKLVSTVGLAELVLLAQETETWRPLAAGDAPASALAAAQAFALLEPACEGLPAGAPLRAVRFASPFRPLASETA